MNRNLPRGTSSKKDKMSTFVLLIVIAMILAIVALIKPSWPLTPVGLLLVCIALLIGKNISL